MSKCSGCPSLLVMNGRLICEDPDPESSIFAFSAVSLSLLIACASEDRSIPVSFLYSSTIQEIMTSSKSSPPRRLSPEVALTSI